MQGRRWFVMACAIAIAMVMFVGEVRAERPRVLGRAMVNSGSAFHGSYRGAENTYVGGGRIGARIRAKQAWGASPGHAANLANGVGGNFFRMRVVGGIFRPAAVVGR